MDTQVVILSAARTPIGRFGGGLKEVSAAQLGTVAARAAIERAGLAPENVDKTVFGCAWQAGNGPNPARQVAYHAGVPVDRSAYTINKACASGMKAVTLGVQSVLAGENEVVLAGGGEQMSQIPYLLTQARWGYRLGDDTLVDAMYLDGYLCPLAEMVMGETADLLAERFTISRAEQDEFAVES
jgi:acetyl-CoA C-acetyltransferase